MKLIIYCISLIVNISLMMGEFKNVQVLEYESERDLKKYMKSISKDLGVKCTFCHDLNDKSLDNIQHKIIAREMMKMQNNLNKQFFSQMSDSLLKQENPLQISCWTCHRGFKEPELVRPK